MSNATPVFASVTIDHEAATEKARRLVAAFGGERGRLQEADDSVDVANAYLALRSSRPIQASGFTRQDVMVVRVAAEEMASGRLYSTGPFPGHLTAIADRIEASLCHRGAA